MMKVLDLFSGIGGFSLGLERAGMETVAFCEVDKDAQAVLRKHWPDVPIYDDVKRIKGSKKNNIDLICGGFPCQDISVAGPKKGLRDELGQRTRSGLWFEFKRLIKEIKPRYAIIENVANLRSKGLNEVLKDLWTLGYDCEWHIISARSIGAPHLRERIWIVAYSSCERRQQESRGPHENEKKDGEKDNNITQCNGKGHRIKQIQRDVADIANSNNFRLWQPFASEKEKQEWWAETTSFVSYWDKTQSIVCGVDDGLPSGPHSDNSGMDKHRVETLKKIVQSKRLCVDSDTGKIFSLVQRGKAGQKIELKGSDLNGYIVHKIYFDGQKHAFRAHQIIMAFNGEYSTDGYVFDHINGNKKDNRHCNLRKVTPKENYENQDRSHIGISDDQASEMYDIYMNSDISFRDLGDMFDCSKSRAQQVVSKHRSEKERKQRIKQLGNSVVPQIPELIGRAIMEYERREQ